MALEPARRALAATAAVLARRGTRRAVAAIALGYLLLYLFAIGDLDLHARVLPARITLSDDPWAVLFKARAPFYFEPAAAVQGLGVSLLVAPLNILIGATLAFLVGINLALGYLALRRPAVCTARPGTGVLAALPGLLAGSACCGPVLLLALGIQASAFLVGLFSMLVPIALALLLGTLVFNGARTDAGRLRGGGA